MTWARESIFPEHSAWEAEFAAVEASLPDLSEFQGRLGDSPATLLDWFTLAETTRARVQRLELYAYMGFATESGDESELARLDRITGLGSRAAAAMAFAEPELIGIGFTRLRAWADENADLGVYRQYFDALEKRAQHVRSEEVEELLKNVADPFGTAAGIHGILANSELTFKPAVDAQGNQHEIAQGNVNALVTGPDRELRRTAWENYADAHLALKRTMATCLAAGIKHDVFNARARRYPSSLEASLDPNHVPVEVFHNMLAAFRRHIPTWHRYWRLVRRALGVDELKPYDTRATLTQGRKVSWEEAVRWTLAGVAPLGEDYVRVLEKGLREDRWVDVLPNQGKQMGAFSYAVPGTRPFIFMSFNEDMFTMSTLAHETGHSMHSYLTLEKQPLAYTDYGLFLAEVASNFHQALVRGHLLDGEADPELQIAVLEEAMSNFYRYFFIMPSLARFELEVHERVERGEAVTADDLTNLMADLMLEVYGDEVVVEGADRDRVGSTWAQFHTHLYMNFYVYQYATGIAGANWLAERVLRGEAGAREAYLEMLSAGSSVYPLDALRSAGVDMTKPEPVDHAFDVMASYVTRLEELIPAR
jgi:oligoendopeptidase F